jgi:hypothetical protein
MAYIGNQPTTAAFVTDTFSANGSGTVFTLSTAPANTSSILVAVSGVLQDPSTYSVAATTLTFSAAPPAGTGNISVRFLGIPASGVTTTAYRTVTEFTATASQTTFTPPSYTAGFINVYRNGVMLGSADYTASNGTTVVLATGATAGDLITTESFYVSSVVGAIPATSGAVTSAYLLDGSVTAAKMAASGAWAPTGTIIQVSNFNYGTTVTSASSTLADTGLTGTITPKFATSKILAFVEHNGCAKVNNAYMQVVLLRGATQLATFGNAIGYTGTTLDLRFGGIGMCYMDSPASTSTLTYKTQFCSVTNAATVTLQDNNGLSTLTLMEITQ